MRRLLTATLILAATTLLAHDAATLTAHALAPKAFTVADLDASMIHAHRARCFCQVTAVPFRVVVVRVVGL